MSERRLFAFFLAVALLFAAAYAFHQNSLVSWVNPELPLYYVKRDGTKVYFNLLDPEEAPAEIRESVDLGFRLMIETPLYAHPYVGDRLTCSNCHLSAGNTLGGKGGGISLVGVTSLYPRKSEREGKVIDLADRINLCFERSMNGLPIPKDGKEMNALIAYMQWISHEADKIDDKPWLGLPSIALTKPPDPASGAKLYEIYCAMCHHQDGQGSASVPPLWGPYSYNSGAGMNQVDILASYIHLNMPFNDPFMTREQALDIASYIVQQPRP